MCTYREIARPKKATIASGRSRWRSRWNIKITAGLALWSILCLSSCAPSLTQLPISKGVALSPSVDGEGRPPLQIKYLGSGGFLLQRRKDVILTAPFFSNPSLFRVLFWSIHADPGQINAFLPPVAEVKAILVGHAHYDHLLDIPYIAQERAPSAIIYGNQTAIHILTAVLPSERLVALDGNGTTPSLLGQWQPIPGTHVRIMAVKSAHAPHVCVLGGCISVFQGDVAQPLDRLPRTAWGWKEGQTLAYLIDFLEDDGTVAFRVHYQDAASGAPSGFPPLPADEQKVVDVAILCVPGAPYVKEYPQGIVGYLKPRYVLLAHWEDFFRPRTGDPGDVHVLPVGTDPKDFMAQVKNAWPLAEPLMPLPGSWVQFSPEHLSPNGDFGREGPVIDSAAEVRRPRQSVRVFRPWRQGFFSQ
jgi:hypothetical protein